MPNPTIVAATKNNAAIAAANTSVTVSSTGNVTAGNLMIVAIEVAGAAAPTGITPPAGWTTFLATTTTETSGLVSAAIFYKVAPTPNAAFSGSFSWTTSSTGGEWLFMEWRGVGALLVDGTVTTQLNSSITNPISPAIAPGPGQVSDTMIGFLFGGVLSTSTVTIPTGTTSILTVNGSATQTLFGAASLALLNGNTANAMIWTLGTAQATLGASMLLQQGPTWGFTSDEAGGGNISVVANQATAKRRRYAGTKGKSEFAIFFSLPVMELSAQPPQPPQPNRPNRAAAIMTGDTGLEQIEINWKNIGWEIQSVQPPHPHPEWRAAAIMPHDDGLEKAEVLTFNWGFEIQSHQPQHQRPERFGAIAHGDDGTEAAFIPPRIISWGYDYLWQPPHPVFKSGALARTDDGVEFMFTNFYPAGWEIQSVQPPTFPPARNRYPGTKGKSEFPIFTFWQNWGWEVQPVQPPHFRPESHHAASRLHDDGSEFNIISSYNAGWEIQSFQPQHPLREKFGSLARGDDGTAISPPVAPFFWSQLDQPPAFMRGHLGAIMPIEPGIEAVFVASTITPVNWGFEETASQPRLYPTVVQRGAGASGQSEFAAFNLLPFIDDVVPLWKYPKRINSAMPGDDGIESVYTAILTTKWGFDAQAYQPQNIRRPGAAIARSDDGIQFPLTSFFLSEWEFQTFTRPYNRTSVRGAAFETFSFVESPITSFFLSEWEFQTFTRPYNRTAVRAGALETFPNIEIPFLNFYPGGWEIQSPQPPHPRSERGGSIMPKEDGIEAVFVPIALTPLTPWAFEAPPPQPPHPRPERGGIMPIEPGIEAQFVFVPIGLSPWIESSLTYYHVPFRGAGALAKGEDGFEFPETLQFNSGWLIQEPSPPHQFRERRGAFLRGDEGIEQIQVSWFNTGWEIQSVQPPHPYPERRAAGIMRGDDGIEAGKINFFPLNWPIQMPQPPHPRPEREAAIARGDDGIEAVYVFIAPPVLTSLAPMDIQPTLRWPMTAVARGAILLFDGLGLPFFPFIPPIPPIPPGAGAAKVIGLDADYGGADVTRVFLSRVPGNLFVGDSIAVIIGVGGDLNLTSSYRMVFTKPDGSQFHIDSPNTYVGTVDAPTRQGTFAAQTYTICILASTTVDQHGTWTCYLQAPEFTSTAQSFYIGPPPMLQ